MNTLIKVDPAKKQVSRRDSAFLATSLLRYQPLEQSNFLLGLTSALVNKLVPWCAWLLSSALDSWAYDYDIRLSNQPLLQAVAK